ncbi:30S ribosomal protein S8 [Ignavibacteria bacterium]|jgi:small subunit ribosomal protein S8|nr:30S ribosomal protein S8 [Bacteroidota bacterium]MCZ2132890.1 30S ribosomal protein S8 [Bacteroidota bacterium]
MPVTDTIADFLTRIRNAGYAKHKTVDTPSSKMKSAIASILKEAGYISNFEEVKVNNFPIIRVWLKYNNGASAIKEITRVSTPGRRAYAPVEKLPRVRNGLGLAVVSTSKGVMSDKEARRQNAGGEIICTVW